MDTLGIVIVSYNVCDLLRDCLASVYDSQGDFALDVCVVDNGSDDGSADMVAVEFPRVRLIRSENRGYAAGNNLGLRALGFGGDGSGPRQGTGKIRLRGRAVARRSPPRYALLLNPDTVVPPSALGDMVGFLDAHPQAGVVGPRLVREDGSLDRACRRSFPTPEVAFYRFSGLSQLFPRSRRFGRYNLTYLPPDLTTQLDSVVGAFLLIRGQTLTEVGLLDEQFFMYAEDLDFCFRAKQRGWQVWYNADVTVLHYKGQSSRQRSSMANVHFYRTMRLFHDKHFGQTSFFLANWLIYSAIGLLGAWAVVRDRLRPSDRRGVASALPLDASQTDPAPGAKDARQ